MSPTPESPSISVRSSAQVNAAIRALRWAAGRGLDEVERAAYERLLAEYAAARRAEKRDGFARAA